MLDWKISIKHILNSGSKIKIFSWLKAIPFFFHLASNAFPDIGLVGWIKKKTKKTNYKKSQNWRPWYPRTTLKVNIYIFGLTKYSVEMFLFLSLFFSMLLLCSFFRLKESFEVKNGLTTSLLLFLFENAKNTGWLDDDK